MSNKKTSKFNTFSLKRKITIISVTVILVLLASVGTTLAFLAMRTGSIKNIFEPVSIKCQVDESNYTVINTGDYSAYIRASAIVNYVKIESKAEGDTSHTVYGVAPKATEDYTIEFNQTDWIKGSDGFYYYKYPVQSGNNNRTNALINSFGPTVNNVTPDGYELSAQIIAEAIQSKPISTVSDKWNVAVDSNGNITGKN